MKIVNIGTKRRPLKKARLLGNCTCENRSNSFAATNPHKMAVNGFSNKVSSACASAIVAGLLAWGAYDGTVAVQSSKANMAILFAFVILPIIANIVSIVVMYFYDLDKQYDQMERELKERRKKLAEQTAE